MPEDVANTIARASAIVIALGVLWRYVLVPAWRNLVAAVRLSRAFMRRMHAAIDIIERELKPAVEQVQAVTTTTAQVVARELTPNSGGSLKDTGEANRLSLDSIQRSLVKINAELTAVNKHIDGVADDMREQRTEQRAALGFAMDEIWDVLVPFGVDRRRPERNQKPLDGRNDIGT